MAYTFLAGLSNFDLCEPLEYAPFIAAMKRAYIILTDSGGVQEEAPALGKPVLVLRDETERPEAVEQGTSSWLGRTTSVSLKKHNGCLMMPPPIGLWRVAYLLMVMGMLQSVL